MKIQTAGRVRGDYIDRGASLISTSTYEATGIGPHANTSRWAYVVPSFRRAVLTGFVASIIRTTVAGTNGRIFERIQTGSSIDELQNFMSNNVADASSIVHTRGRSDIGAAGSWTGFTSDASTTGTVDYILDARIVEYDAV